MLRTLKENIITVSGVGRTANINWKRYEILIHSINKVEILEVLATL